MILTYCYKLRLKLNGFILKSYLLLLLLLFLLFTAIEFSLGGSSPYSITDKRDENKYT